MSVLSAFRTFGAWHARCTRRRSMLVRLTAWSVVFGILATVAAGCASLPPDEEQGETASNEVVASWPIVAANNKIAFDYFLGKGLTKIQAAGIVGNLDQESGMDPTISQIGGGPGRGIAQWSAGGRWDKDTNDNVRAFAAQEGKPMKSLDVQLDFVWYELTTFPHYGALRRLRRHSEFVARGAMAVPGRRGRGFSARDPVARAGRRPMDLGHLHPVVAGRVHRRGRSLARRPAGASRFLAGKGVLAARADDRSRRRGQRSRVRRARL
jgi:hypothetical protein